MKVIDFGQLDFTKILEIAIQFGKPVLLQNVGETLDPALNTILQKAFVKTGFIVFIFAFNQLINNNQTFN